MSGTSSKVRAEIRKRVPVRNVPAVPHEHLRSTWRQARPGRIRAIRDIPLPRPRDVHKIRFTPEFARHYEELWDVLKDEVAKGTDM